MKISINAPSYKRPNNVETLKYLPNTRIWVDGSEYEAYKKNYPNADIVKCADGIQGNVCRVRNYILDEEYKRGMDVVVQIDDDLQYLGYFENKEIYKMNEKEVMAFIRRYSLFAEEWGARLWGINLNPDKQNYREYTPFSTVSYIGSPFMAHVRSDIRFDERFSLKEDYDLTLQHMEKYRIALRVNKFYYHTRQHSQVGGVAVYRNMDREIAQLDELQKKWGSRIVRKDTNDRSHNSKKTKSHDINPVIYIPIKGV